MSSPGSESHIEGDGLDENASWFASTHWTVVLSAAQGDTDRALVALERLCRIYWQPIYAFVRRRGFAEHDAKDLTQSFFAALLEKEAIKKADRGKGRFRNFLLASLANFLANDWDKRRAIKRGGECQIVSFDEAAAEGWPLEEAVDNLTPEKVFEQRWAVALVGQVLSRLREEYSAGAKTTLFAKLKPALTGEDVPGACAAWASELGMSEGAVKVALHRLRRRFGELLRSEIAHTVSSPEEIPDEIRQLFAAISR